MASCLADVHKSIPAIKIPANNAIHRVVASGGQTCRGGICIQTLLNIFEDFMVEYHQMYLASLPAKYREFDPKAAKACLQELR